MNIWIKISSEELEKSKEIIELKKGDLQIQLVKALVKIDKAIEYVNTFKNDMRGLDEIILLEILEGKDE